MNDHPALPVSIRPPFALPAKAASAFSISPVSPHVARAQLQERERNAHLTGTLSQQARWGRSFCDDVSYGRAGHSYLQGAYKHQADHDDGTGQHADRDQLAFTVALHNKGPTAGLNGEPHRQRGNLLDRPDGHKERVRRLRTAARAHQLELGRSWP